MKPARPRKPAKRAVTRILIVDDHPMIRERLTDVIQREQDLTVCGDAEDVHSALAAIERTHPDLAIVDLVLRGDSHGLDLIKDMRIRYPEVAILGIGRVFARLALRCALSAGRHAPVGATRGAGVVTASPLRLRTYAASCHTS